MGFKHLEFESPPPFAADAEPVASLRRIVTGEEIAHVTYLGVSLPNVPPDTPLYYSTYPTSWADRYIDRHYFDVDPTLTVGMHGILPFDWGAYPIAGRKARNFMGEAREFGLQKQGLSIPIRGPHGDQALFSVNSALNERDWREFKRSVFGDLSLFAYHFHLRVLERLGIPERPDVRLAPREREVLLWASAGKSLWETAEIVGVRPKTVEFYLRNAMVKLGATNKTQAVANALRYGLLR